jgi:hypothetical protein
MERSGIRALSKAQRMRAVISTAKEKSFSYRSRLRDDRAQNLRRPHISMDTPRGKAFVDLSDSLGMGIWRLGRLIFLRRSYSLQPGKKDLCRAEGKRVAAKTLASQ